MPSRREQDRFGERAKLFGFAVKNEGADFFGIGRTARFTGCDHRHPQRLDPGPKPRYLGGFPGPLPAFERDESPCHQMPLNTSDSVRRTQPVPTSSRPSKARWRRVPTSTSSLA